MKKYWKVIGVVTIVAGILYYPAVKLYQLITKQKGEDDEREADVRVKVFSPAYRGKHNPHHRHSHNGDSGHKLA